MRKIIHPKIRLGYIAIFVTLFILLVLNIFCIPNVLADQEDELVIYLTDENDNPISELYEEIHFKVSVYVLNESGKPDWLTEVDIKFNEKPYRITGEEVVEITLQAPLVDGDTPFNISVSKEGYTSNYTILTVLNSAVELPQLIVTPEKWTVNVNEEFSVLVTTINEKGEEVNVSEGIAVSILEEPGVKDTNSDGRVWLIAPDNPGDITIQAQKDDEYKLGQATIVVKEAPTWWSFIYSTYFPIAAAIICLICVIIFVNIRSRRSIYDRAKEISNEKMIKRHEIEEKDIAKSEVKKDILDFEGFSGKPVRSQSSNDSKVEEIRISRSRREKEIVKVETDEDKANKIATEKRIKKKDYDWFEGTDDIRYEIDKLTGEIDEDGIDKWFEGVGDLKDKIDKKVKKKKNEEKEE